MPDVNPQISCVMLTTARRERLRWATLQTSLLAQRDPPPFELVIAIDAGDQLSELELSAMAIQGIVPKVVQGTWPTVTDKQNAAVAATTAPWVTLWDDDDWSAADRLTTTAAAVRQADLNRHRRLAGDARYSDRFDLVGQGGIFYHELRSVDRRTVCFSTRAHIVDGLATFRRSLWEAQPFVVKGKIGDVGDWIVRRIAEGSLVYDIHFGYVAMIHGDNVSTPRPFRVDPVTGKVFDGDEFQVLGGPEIAARVMGADALQRYELAVAGPW